MSEPKMLTREEIEAVRHKVNSSMTWISQDNYLGSKELDALCTTALALMAQVESLIANESHYRDLWKKAEAEAERLRPVVEAAREEFKSRVWQMICDLPGRDFDDEKYAAVSMEEIASVLDRAFEALEEAEGK